jgi:hypothetical protein
VQYTEEPDTDRHAEKRPWQTPDIAVAGYVTELVGSPLGKGKRSPGKDKDGFKG